MWTNESIAEAMEIKLDKDLPGEAEFSKFIRRAPKRELTLTQKETEIALKNALRYVPEELHQALAPEFLEELFTMGRIYGYRFRPNEMIYGKFTGSGNVH